MQKQFVKYKNILLVAVLLLSLSSCKFLILKMYGIKTPAVENEKSIIKFAKKKKLRTDNIVTVNADDFLKIIKTTALPDADIFDSEGRHIEYRATDTSCNAGLFKFIPALKKDGVYKKTGKTNLEAELKMLLDIKGNAMAPLPPADFYVFIYWAVWEGKLNKDHVKAWEDLALANGQANVKVVKVNMDLQQYWDAAKRDTIIKKISRKK